ncbi:F-box domain-containing protein [Pleurotus pulmonarius]
MLPVELLLQIFEHLHDDRPTLLNLLLVSHHFAQLSESILYADVTLHPARICRSRPRRTVLACFAESLSGPTSSVSPSPRRRGPMVKHLFIDGSDIPSIAQSEYSQLDLILTRLPHLQSFHFTHLANAVRWSPFATSRITAPPFQLARLIFNAAIHPSYAPKMVHGFLASQTRLEHLEIGSIIEEALGSANRDGATASADTELPPPIAPSSLRILETSALGYFLDAGKTSNLTHLKLSSSASPLDMMLINSASAPRSPLANLRVLSTSQTPHLPSSESGGSPSATAATLLPNLEYWELRSEWVDLAAFLQEPCVRRFLVSLPRLKALRFSADVAVHSREGVAQTFESVLGLEFIEVRLGRKREVIIRYYRGEEKPRRVQWRRGEGAEWCQTWEHDASAT